MFSIGQTLKFTCKDGTTYTGHCTLSLEGGATTIRLGDDTVFEGYQELGSFEVVSEEAIALTIPRDYQQAATSAIMTMATPKGTGKSFRSGTKLSQAIALFTTMKGEGSTRKQTIAAFMDKLTMSEAGASTYYNMCQKSQLN